MQRWFAKPSSASASTDPRAATFGPWASVRYRAGARRGHVESWFLKANDPRGRRAVWLKWTIWAGQRAPDRAVAEAWAIAFGTAHGHVATKTSVPFDRGSFDGEGLGVDIDGCVLSGGAARGRVESGGRSVAYDLTIAPLEGPLAHFPAEWMYSGPLPSQKIVSPVPHGLVSGEVRVGGEATGERWTLDGWPGMVGHNWGRGHSESYAWGHCNAWDGEDDVVVEGLSARVRVGPLLTPTTTLVCVRHHGVRYDLTGLASLVRNEGAISPRRWTLHARGPRIDVEGELWADTEDFVGLFYPNPDGTMCHCLNSKLAHARVTLCIAGRAPRELRSTRAALEIGTRDPNHGVRMVV
jgi:hypothetical protein